MRIAATVAAAAGSLTWIAITRRMPARTRAADSSHHGPGVASTIDAVLIVANRRSPLRASARSASGTPKLRYGNGRRTEANVARTTRPRVQARRGRVPNHRGPSRGRRVTSVIHAPFHDTLRHVEVERDASTRRHPCVVAQDAIDLQHLAPCGRLLHGHQIDTGRRPAARVGKIAHRHADAEPRQSAAHADPREAAAMMTAARARGRVRRLATMARRR